MLLFFSSLEAAVVPPSREPELVNTATPDLNLNTNYHLQPRNNTDPDSNHSPHIHIESDYSILILLFSDRKHPIDHLLPSG